MAKVIWDGTQGWSEAQRAMRSDGNKALEFVNDNFTEQGRLKEDAAARSRALIAGSNEFDATMADVMRQSAQVMSDGASQPVAAGAPGFAGGVPGFTGSVPAVAPGAVAGDGNGTPTVNLQVPLPMAAAATGTLRQQATELGQQIAARRAEAQALIQKLGNGANPQSVAMLMAELNKREKALEGLMATQATLQESVNREIATSFAKFYDPKDPQKIKQAVPFLSSVFGQVGDAELDANGNLRLLVSAGGRQGWTTLSSDYVNGFLNRYSTVSTEQSFDAHGNRTDKTSLVRADGSKEVKASRVAGDIEKADLNVKRAQVAQLHSSANLQGQHARVYRLQGDEAERQLANRDDLANLEAARGAYEVAKTNGRITPEEYASAVAVIDTAERGLQLRGAPFTDAQRGRAQPRPMDSRIHEELAKRYADEVASAKADEVKAIKKKYAELGLPTGYTDVTAGVLPPAGSNLFSDKTPVKSKEGSIGTFVPKPASGNQVKPGYSAAGLRIDEGPSPTQPYEPRIDPVTEAIRAAGRVVEDTWVPSSGLRFDNIAVPRSQR